MRLNVRVRAQNKIFADVTISKTYGDIWKFDSKEQTHYVQIAQLLSGSSKEFLFEVNIPQITQKLQDFERNASFIEVTLIAKSIDGAKTVQKTAELSLALYNEDEDIIPEVNDDVQINVLRVQGAEAIDKARLLAEQGSYDQGQQLMQAVQQKIQMSKPMMQERLQMLNDDLLECAQNCNTTQYESQGKKKMISNQRFHMEQRSKGINVDQDMYQNVQQKAMVNYMKSKK